MSFIISVHLQSLFLWWSQVLFFAWCLGLKLIVLCIYGSPSASDHRLPKSLRISVASTVFTAYRDLIHDWFTWVFLLVGTDRQAAVLLWYFCHHEIPCLFHLKFYFSPWILNKVLGCFVAWFCEINFASYSGTSLLLIYVCPLVCIAWITVHALKFVLCAVSMVLCDFFPCSATLLIIQVCYFMVSACGLTEVIGALYGLHAYFRLLFWATTDMLMCLLLAAIKAVCFHFYNCVIARCLLGSPNILPMACVTLIDIYIYIIFLN